MMGSDLSFDDLVFSHCNWVDSMGWHKSTVLEGLALIYSEVSEAFELVSQVESLEFRYELADIALRLMDQMYVRGFKVELPDYEVRGVVPYTSFSKQILAEQYLVKVLVDLGVCVNSCRHGEVGDRFGVYMGRCLDYLFKLGGELGFDLLEVVAQKMAVNFSRGSRGRVI